MIGRILRQAKREPAAICAGAAWFVLLAHNGWPELWTIAFLPIGAVLSFVIDELWQDKLDADNEKEHGT